MMCWTRAKFLAIRSALRESWQPRDAQEEHLIDQMAQYQTLVERWQQMLVAYTSLANMGLRRRNNEVRRRPSPSRVVGRGASGRPRPLKGGRNSAEPLRH